MRTRKRGRALPCLSGEKPGRTQGKAREKPGKGRGESRGKAVVEPGKSRRKAGCPSALVSPINLRGSGHGTRALFARFPVYHRLV